LKNNFNIVLTGGGTGGHLSIVKTLAKEFNKIGVRPVFIGTSHGQDKDWFEDSKLFRKCYFLDVVSPSGKNPIKKLNAYYKIFKALNKCVDIFEYYHIDKVVSVGGYASTPASLASILNKYTLVIHEQNAIIGRSNKIFKYFSSLFLSSYDKSSPVKHYPIQEKFFDTASIRNQVKTIIFLGGSQGARAINNFALSVAPYLNDKGIKIIHQTGKNEFEKVEQAYKELKIYPTLFAFDDNLAKHIGKSDFAVSRSGAGTLWELTANAIPTLFVPYPYAMDDHQYYNAKFLADKNLCFLVREDELSQEVLENALNSNIKKMSLGLEKQTFLKGGRLIVDEIMDL
jgi:UDP-N-acetylglucosamine--N-acetylmuramyl-(pentapeptide) pyrophosphoryl-undecaprenol N-acetylglucosamine transferase